MISLLRSTWLATVTLALVATASANGPTGFQRGQGLYESGEFKDAAAAYASDVTEGRVSPGLLHNLGNAEFKAGRVGHAILAWEQARSLDPAFRNSIANLHFARGKMGLEEPRMAWHETYALWRSADFWIITAISAFWIAIAFLALPRLLRRRRTAWTQAGAVAASVVFLLTTPALLGIMSRGRVGVIVAAETDLRLTPTAEAEPLGSLPEGELARVEKTRGEYIYVRGSNDRAGWVRKAEFARIWP